MDTSMATARGEGIEMRIGLLATARRFEDAYLSTSDALFRASGGNLGNFAFVEALWRHLSPNAQLLPWHVSPAEAREKCDLLVFAAANQLGSHTDLDWLANHFEKIGLPIVVVGLGAQASNMASVVQLSPGTERWARVIASLAPTNNPNIGVRGDFTRRALETLGLGDRAAIMGCPSNFLNDRPDFYSVLQRNLAKRRIDRLCAAAGSRHFASARDVERSLARLVGETGGLYVAQAEIEMVSFARGEIESIDPAELEAIRNFVTPSLPLKYFLVWRQRHAVCFADATSWMDAVRNCDFAVGARIHGVVLAIQAGVPGGVIAHDSRTLELSQTMAIPVRSGAEIPANLGLADLYRLFEWDLAAFAATRERLRKVYLDLLRGCGVEPSPRLAAAQKFAA
jgi:hypothetical protein